ncbi:interleukin-12 receptor subunit beta-2 isoform X3 [Apodemus sylvaticus]|uniref:interleukin-12 receptor subunit beta-2 isoform X3 n=1 Tax=Apodemus sylvaticus TaxID=10129 RepID=UPI0022446C6F|nr:interleukin-12 receptor subunit beta-2 isoform X3 [Apodemus sylvaticus]
MAHTVGECSLALIFLFMWLRIKANIDVCKLGTVTVQPAPVIPLGSTANISCSLNPKQGCSHHPNSNKLILLKFVNDVLVENLHGKKVHDHPGHSSTFQVTNLSLGMTLFVCKLNCSNFQKTQPVPVCGVEISVGVAPEPPQNITCVQEGEHGTVACSWNPGKVTYLKTYYTLQLSGPNNVTCQKQCYSDNHQNCNHLDLGINLTPDLAESRFLVSVTAVNDLGNSSSLPHTFTFLDIVRPLPPWDIRIDFLNASGSRCTLQWEDEGQVVLNRLRYQPLNSTSWNMVNATNAKGRYDLQDLRPFTEYEFQISSKLHLSEGSWSPWSESLRTRTPEEAPVGTLDIWYLKQDIDYDRQQISLFWKSLNPSEARGKILHYQVTLQEVTKKMTLQNTTRHTSWTGVIPRTGTWTASVSAANSKGASAPTRINIVDLCGTELLAPQQVSAKSENVDNIMVTWRPPRKAASAVWEYIVEWRALQPGSITTFPPHWLRIPPYNMSALISEGIKPYICYEIWVHALSDDQGGCSSIRGDSRHKAPLSGPHITAITEKKESLVISWTHIPFLEQRGCILHYRIYWKERDSPAQPERCGKVNWKTFVISSICIAIIIVGTFSTRYFRQKAFTLLSTLKPQWYSRTIPDPANSTWVKKYPIMEEKIQLPMDNLLMALPTIEEPETLIINEVLYQMIPAIRQPYCFKKGQEFQGYSTSKEDTIYIATNPQATGTLTDETRQLVNLYKVLGSRDPDSKLGNLPNPLTVTPVNYLPSHEGYLPSNIVDLSPHDTDPTDSLDLAHQHISLSIFAPSSLHPLTFCGERLTLDRLKMGYDSLMSNEA